MAMFSLVFVREGTHIVELDVEQLYDLNQGTRVVKTGSRVTEQSTEIAGELNHPKQWN